MLLFAARRSLGARAAVRALSSQAKHTSLEVTDKGIAIIRLDCQGEKQNTLSEDLIVRVPRRLSPPLSASLRLLLACRYPALAV
jgi:hypothetical protein